MKILFITHPLAFQAPGGGEQIILQSRDALHNRGHQVDLFDPWLHKVQDYDIVHFFSCHTWWDWKTIKSFDIPLVVTPTSWAAGGSFSKGLEKIKDLIRSRFGTRDCYSLRAYFNYPDLLLPTTPLEQELLAKFYDISNEKMVSIGNGIIPPEKIDPSNNQFIKDLGLKDFILFSGSIRPNKNVDKLIQDCQRLGQKLVVMGEASFDTKEYAAYCRSLAGPETHFTGFIEKESQKYSEVYCASSVVAIPSDFETFCLAAAEGSAIGKPVVIPNAGGTTSVFQDGAFYVSTGKNQRELEDAIQRALDAKCSRSLQNLDFLQTRMNERFAWSIIAERLENAYKKLI